MNCPYCKSGMRTGKIYARGGAGIFWLPEGRNVPAFITKRAILHCDGILLEKINTFGPAKASACLCEKCRKVIIAY